MHTPRGVVGMPDGGFLFPGTDNQRVRRVFPDGSIATVAGNGLKGFSGDGRPATSAQLSIPFGVAPTPDGGFSHRRRRQPADQEGLRRRDHHDRCGRRRRRFSGDGGPATNAQLKDPHNVVALTDGSFLVADASNKRIRLVSADGTISTFAGTGLRGFSGDGGAASAAQIAVPKAVAVTRSGDVLIATEPNERIRFVGTIIKPARSRRRRSAERRITPASDRGARCMAGNRADVLEPVAAEQPFGPLVSRHLRGNQAEIHPHLRRRRCDASSARSRLEPCRLGRVRVRCHQPSAGSRTIQICCLLPRLGARLMLLG
jgi:hypothetical protein